MALYFLLGTLTQEGQRMLHDNPELTTQSIRSCSGERATILSLYVLIGKQDFLIMAEADDNESIARLSSDIGVRVGLHIETLPAIAIGFLAEHQTPGPEDDAEYSDNPPSDRGLPTHESLQPLTDIYGPGRD